MKFRPSRTSRRRGANGGDVYVRAVRDVNVWRYTGNKEFKAVDGEAERKNSEYGKGSEDLYIDIPSARVTDLERNEPCFDGRG